eukprot:COSAG02_NODE_7626_length_2927_cov_6.608911_3_plen_137_part_00
MLGVLGASREDIIADYLESNAHLDHNIAVLDLAAAASGQVGDLFTTPALPCCCVVRRIIRAELDATLHVRQVIVPPSDDRRTALEVTRGVMQGTLDLIDEHGGFHRYLQSIGFGAEDVQKLKDLLTNQRSTDHPKL